MSQYLIRSFRDAVLLSLLTVALVATAFAHRIPSVAELQIEAYVLAGGDLSDLCGGDHDGSGGKGGLHHGDCPACHVAGSLVFLGGPAGLVEANLSFIARVVAPQESAARRLVLDPANGTRAPPLA